MNFTYKNVGNSVNFQSYIFIFVYMEAQTRTDLIKVSTYAQKNRKSTTWVYDQIKEKKVQLVVIDGVKFIKEPK